MSTSQSTPLESEKAGPEPEHRPDRWHSEATAWVEWFDRKFGRSFRVNKQTVAQVKTLLQRKHTQRDMRMVALFLRSRWEHDPKMREFLKPSAILRGEKFSERLDEAREWWGVNAVDGVDDDHV